MVFIFITRRSYYYYYDKYYGVNTKLKFFLILTFDVSSVIAQHARRFVAVDLISHRRGERVDTDTDRETWEMTLG